MPRSVDDVDQMAARAFHLAGVAERRRWNWNRAGRPSRRHRRSFRDRPRSQSRSVRGHAAIMPVRPSAARQSPSPGRGRLAPPYRQRVATPHPLPANRITPSAEPQQVLSRFCESMLSSAADERQDEDSDREPFHSVSSARRASKWGRSMWSPCRLDGRAKIAVPRRAFDRGHVKERVMQLRQAAHEHPSQ